MDIVKLMKKIFEKPPVLTLEEEYPKPETNDQQTNPAKKYW